MVSWIPWKIFSGILLWRLFLGGVPEWSKGTDCKSVGDAFGGSNPPPTTNHLFVAYCRRFRTIFQRDRVTTQPLIADGPVWVSVYSLMGRSIVWCRAGVAQLVELQPSKLNVASSSLVSRSNKTIHAHVAQSVERFLGKEEVHRFDSGRGLHWIYWQ